MFMCNAAHTFEFCNLEINHLGCSDRGKVKGIFTQKNIVYPRAIQEVDEFVSLSEQICRNLALIDLFANVSSAVNGCRQNESLNI